MTMADWVTLGIAVVAILYIIGMEIYERCFYSPDPPERIEPHLEVICPSCDLMSCSECPGWRNRHRKGCERGD